MNTALAVKAFRSIDFNRLVVWALAGAVGGLIAGLVSRVSMRFVALLAGMPTEFSLGGTFGILVIGVVFGIPFAMIFATLRRFIPLPVRWQGLAYGLILGVLFVVLPFLFLAEGELTLISPLVGILLFLPVPLTFGLALTLSMPKIEDRYSLQLSQKGALWLVLLGLGLVFSLTSMGKLVSEFPLIPRALVELYQGAGISKSFVTSLHNGLMIFFMVVYLGLVLLIFWRGSRFWLAKFAALAFLLFAGAFFARGILPGEAMNALPLIGIFPGLVRSLGWAMLLIFFYLFPDGQFVPRWTRGAALLWSLVYLVWFFDLFAYTYLNPGNWPLSLRFFLLWGGLASALVAQIIRYRQATYAGRAQTRPVVASLAIFVLAFGLLLAGVLLNREWIAGGHIDYRLSFIFSFSPYLLLWLLLPASLAYTLLRHGLWARESTGQTEAEMMD